MPHLELQMRLLLNNLSLSKLPVQFLSGTCNILAECLISSVNDCITLWRLAAKTDGFSACCFAPPKKTIFRWR